MMLLIDVARGLTSEVSSLSDLAPRPPGDSIMPDLTRHMRLLVYLPYGPGPARLGRGVRQGARIAAVHCELVRLTHGASCRSPWRGEAQEGSAQLKVALPSPPVITGFQARGKHMGHVVIGMDPHKRSATIEIIDDRQKVLFGGRFGTDRDGYRAMLADRKSVV